MADNVVIEDARPEHRERVADLFIADLETLRLRKTREELLAVIDGLITRRDCGEVFWVALDQGRAVGALLATRYTSVKHGGPSLWLEQLFVDPTARRVGAGKALVQRLLAWAADNGIVGIDLESYQLNAPASCLYRSLGFRRLGRERFTIDLPR